MNIHEYKIIVMGDGGVGKSAITVRFIQDVFIEKYDPTIEDSYRRQLELDDRMYIIEVLDTAGTEQFTSMRDLYIKDGNGFILVYSVISKNTLDELYNIHDQIIRVKDIIDIPIIVCGNKCDLEKDRIISLEDGVKFANDLNCEHLETSAKESYNIDILFYSLIRKIYEYQQNLFNSGIKNKNNRCHCI